MEKPNSKNRTSVKISIIMPTRNRGYTLERVLPSYFEQKYVNEIVIVEDASEDDTRSVVESIGKNYPNVKLTYFRFDERQGAAKCRNQGVKLASNEWILIGEDDAYLEKNYAETLINKMEGDVGLASGRLIDLSPGEDPIKAISRFGFGQNRGEETFNFITFSHNPNAFFEGDITLPLTHALILAKKTMIEKFPFDPTYSRGNGFREESEFQIQALVNGYKILVTNDTHAMHLSRSDVKSGGQRTSLIKRFFWNLYYTNYFYKKHFKQIKKTYKLSYPRPVASLLYGISFGKEVLQAVTKKYLIK